MAGARQILLAHPDAEVDGAAAAREEAVLARDQVTGDQGKQIAGLGEGIVPFGPVPAPVRLAAGDRVAVRQKDRIGRTVGGQRHAVAAEHVGPVGERRDAPETLGLALGAQQPARRIEAHQLGVGGG